jgi:hypothetical protein
MSCMVDSCIEGFGPLAPPGLATTTARVSSDVAVETAVAAAAGGAAKPAGTGKSAARKCGVRVGAVAVGFFVGLGL